MFLIVPSHTNCDWEGCSVGRVDNLGMWGCGVTCRAPGPKPGQSQSCFGSEAGLGERRNEEEEMVELNMGLNSPKQNVPREQALQASETKKSSQPKGANSSSSIPAGCLWRSGASWKVSWLPAWKQFIPGQFPRFTWKQCWLHKPAVKMSQMPCVLEQITAVARTVFEQQWSQMLLWFSSDTEGFWGHAVILPCPWTSAEN